MGIIKYQTAWLNDAVPPQLVIYKPRKYLVMKDIGLLTNGVLNVFAKRGDFVMGIPEINSNPIDHLNKRSLIKVYKAENPYKTIVIKFDGSKLQPYEDAPIPSGSTESNQKPFEYVTGSPGKQYKLTSTARVEFFGGCKIATDRPLTGAIITEKGRIKLKTGIGVIEAILFDSGCQTLLVPIMNNSVEEVKSNLASETLTGIGNVVSNGNWQSRAIYGGLFCLFVFGILKWQKII